jgi:hypothetical protein
MVTLLTAAGMPDVKKRLMKGDTFAGRKYRAHPHGYNMLDDLSGKTRALTGLSGVASGRFGSIAPRYRAHADEPIAHASAFGFGIEAGGTDRPPAVQHDRAPGVLGLDLETDTLRRRHLSQMGVTIPQV